MSNSKIRVLLVDDHQVLLDGLQLLLKNEAELEIVGTAENGRQLLDLLDNFTTQEGAPPVDLILMDITMPVMDGLTATKKVKKRHPGIKVIMLTMQNQLQYLKEAVARGADGFLSKKAGKEEITEAIRKVIRNGEFVINADLDKRPALTGPAQENTRSALLTDREKQIICLICKEYSLADIATSLSLSTVSIDAQRRNILSKLGVRSNIGIVREAIKRNLCPDQVPPQ